MSSDEDFMLNTSTDREISTFFKTFTQNNFKNRKLEEI